MTLGLMTSPAMLARAFRTAGSFFAAGVEGFLPAGPGLAAVVASGLSSPTTVARRRLGCGAPSG